MIMKLATNKKVIRLRTRKSSIEYVLKTILNRADTLEGVIVLEITNRKQKTPFYMANSKMTHSKLVWALRMAELRIDDMLRNDSNKESDPKLIG